MKKYRRGFKTEANWYARELRTELGLRPHEPLCPWKLADQLQIPCHPLSSLQKEAPEAVKVLMEDCQNEFFAVTICKGSRRLIYYNDAHHIKRQRADISHELSHALLDHPPMPPLNESGSLNRNQNLEDEANWMGPALLISEEAALFIAQGKINIDQASELYGASTQVINMRLNVTGALSRVRKFRRQ